MFFPVSSIGPPLRLPLLFVPKDRVKDTHAKTYKKKRFSPTSLPRFFKPTPSFFTQASQTYYQSSYFFNLQTHEINRISPQWQQSSRLKSV